MNVSMTCFCARDRNRTDTPLLAADFESAASTNFATRAILNKNFCVCCIFLPTHSGCIPHNNGLQYYAIPANCCLMRSRYFF